MNAFIVELPNRPGSLARIAEAVATLAALAMFFMKFPAKSEAWTTPPPATLFGRTTRNAENR